MDLVLLGLGDNGHTASLFPGSDVLDEQERWVAAAFEDPATAAATSGSGERLWRVTLTAPFINRAGLVLFVVSGASKAAVVKAAIEGEGDPRDLPARLIRPVQRPALVAARRRGCLAAGAVAMTNVAPDDPGIRLLLADVDGTLVTSAKVLAPSTIRAARLLKERGIALAITSSRPPRGLLQFIEALGIDTPTGAFNGGALVKPDLTRDRPVRPAGRGGAKRGRTSCAGRGSTSGPTRQTTGTCRIPKVRTWPASRGRSSSRRPWSTRTTR